MDNLAKYPAMTAILLASAETARAWAARELPEWAFDKFGGAEYWQWGALMVTALLGLLFRGITRRLLGWFLRWSRRSPVGWHAPLIKELTAPLAMMAAAGFWLVAIFMLGFKGRAETALTFTAKVLICLATIWALYRLAHVLHLVLVNYARREDNNLDEPLVNLITRIFKIIVVVIGVLVAMQNLGYQVVPVLASLGIGGLAVALAAKDTLANFFGSIMIMIDRPFRVGHYIKVGAQEGTVEEIGFRSTKIRTPQDSVVSVTSSELSTAAVENLGLRRCRRVRTTLGVTYDTTPERMTAFVDGIKGVLDAQPLCRKNYLVAFTEFNGSSLDVLVNFFLDVPDVAGEAREKEKIFLEFMRLAERVGVSFAFPSQSVYIEKMPLTVSGQGQS
ncbi:MAG: mechanosensitive ion channel family protein [Verrucomicrobiales bacterium]|jgi:MscS family membrane protein|nr:mechanosensitive ion channel family protein [Verrucomicrobiales bacterium]